MRNEPDKIVAKQHAPPTMPFNFTLRSVAEKQCFERIKCGELDSGPRERLERVNIGATVEALLCGERPTSPQPAHTRAHALASPHGATSA